MAGSSVELATAYVGLAVSTRGLGKDVAKELGGIEAQAEKTGKKAGGRMSGALGGALKAGAVGIAAAGIATLGTALVKGFSRLSALDQATAKLSGLGHSAESVEAIMNDALKAVKGTAFGMGEAATTAAGAVAAGIKPGKDLERTLKLVGDAATIAGTDMGSMGSIFNKVATSGKVQGDVINQLGDRGIPILQLLADELGVTAAEVSEMSRKGTIDFDTFRNAMEKGLGGAAQESGKTFEGAMSNVMASLGRVGANLLEGIFPLVVQGLGGIQGALGPVEDVAKKVGEAIGVLFGALAGQSELNEFDGKLQTLNNVGVNVYETFRTLGEGLTVFFDAVAGRSELNEFDGTLQTLNNIGVTINDTFYNLGQGLKVFFDAVTGNSELNEFDGNLRTINNLGTTISDVLHEVGQTVGPILKSISDAFGPVIKSLMDQFGPMLKDLAPQILGVVQNLSPMSLIFKSLQPILPQIVDLIATLVESLGGALATILPTVVSVLATLGEVFASAIVPILSDLISTLLPVFLSIWQSIVPVLTMIVKTVLPALTDIFATIVPIIGDLVRSILPALASLFAAIVPIIGVVVKVIGLLVAILVPILVPIIKVLAKLIGAVLGVALKLIAGIIEKVVVPVISFLIGVISKLLDGILWLVTKGKKFFSDLWNTIKAVVTKIALSIAKFVMQVVKKFFELRRNVLEIVQLVRDKIAAFFGKIRDTVVNIVTGIRDAVVTRFTNLRDRVLSVVTKFRDKIKNAFQKIKDGIVKIAQGIRDTAGGIFDKISDFAKKPIKFVIQTVLNNGLIKGANTVAKVVGLGANWIPNIPLPKGFAGGGWTGPGSKFQPAGVVHADEFVIQKSMRGMFEKKFPGYLQHINQHGTLPGYASGGQVAPVSGKGNRHGTGYPWATWAGDFPQPMGTPIAAWKDGIIALVRHLTTSYGQHVRINHDDGTSSLYAHMSKILVGVGQRVLAGQKIGLVGSTGNSTGPHLHFETMGGPYTAKGKGGLLDLFKGFPNPISWLSDLIGGALGKNVGGGLLGDIVGKVPGMLADAVKSKISLFDNGGWLKPGHLAYNGLSRPEPILTPGQWDKVGRSGDQHITFNLPNVNPHAALAAAGQRLRRL